MKQLLKVKISFADLYGMLPGPIQSKLMLTGIEMKVFGVEWENFCGRTVK